MQSNRLKLKKTKRCDRQHWANDSNGQLQLHNFWRMGSKMRTEHLACTKTCGRIVAAITQFDYKRDCKFDYKRDCNHQPSTSSQKFRNLFQVLVRLGGPRKQPKNSVRWYKLLYKQWALSMGEGDFRPPTAPRSLDQFSWNLKYITTSLTWHHMQNFRGLYRRGWSGQIASLTHESFCPFFRFFATPTGRIFGHIPTLNTSLCVVPAKEVPWGLERLNLKFDPLYPSKRKNWDFKLAVNGKL